MKIFIWGAGGHGRVVLDILRESNDFKIEGFIDSDRNLTGKVIDGVSVLGDKSALEILRKRGVQAGIVAIGDNEARCEVADYLKRNEFELVSAIHPSAVVTSSASIGKNVTVAAGALICAHSIIEDNVIINTGSIVEHESIIKNGVHVTPGAKLAGRIEVGEKAFIGIGATVIQLVKIGKNSIIGAGAVVLEDIPDNVVVVGIPAKVIRERTKKDLF